jgi:hypothetical protein
MSSVSRYSAFATLILVLSASYGFDIGVVCYDNLDKPTRASRARTPNFGPLSLITVLTRQSGGRDNQNGGAGDSRTPAGKKERMNLERRINNFPKWARDYIHRVQTFVGAPEVQELIQLRDERRQLIKAIGDLKAENKRLRKWLER